MLTYLFASCSSSQTSAYQRAEMLVEAPNFRDLGGYPVSGGKQTVWRKVFRSQSFAALSDSDVEKVKTLGIKTVIDFRDDSEVKKAPSRLPAGVNVVRLPIGVGNNETALRTLQGSASGTPDSAQCVRFMEEANRRFVAEFAPQYKAFFAILLKPESYPLVFHCTAGKDRTGFAAAMLLSALGMSWDAVMDDYLLTNTYLRPQAVMPQTPQQRLPVLRQMLGVQSSYIEAAKDEIEKRYGSIDSYLEKALGVGKPERKKLAKLLLK
ncbi:MAG: tyrosine-protein phosphatase [Prevotellaceae bacterium]|nr:tyrosine-protein phosphatase [Prevotellaceae bacterium]